MVYRCLFIDGLVNLSFQFSLMSHICIYFAIGFFCFSFFVYMYTPHFD